MTSFDELAASRRAWIDDVLQPWCVQANLKDLKAADLEWMDIAGKVDANATLWTWAWSRFPALVHDGIAGVNETLPVRVHLKSGDTAEGYPDGRKSDKGKLVLVSMSGADEEFGPFTIDEIESAEALSSQ